MTNTEIIDQQLAIILGGMDNLIKIRTNPDPNIHININLDDVEYNLNKGLEKICVVEYAYNQTKESQERFDRLLMDAKINGYEIEQKKWGEVEYTTLIKK